MVGSRAYDFMYRVWAPWDSVGVRSELKTVLDRGLVSARTHPRAIDLGCGTGANVAHLAGLGFDAHGVDFSSVALDKAQARAAETRVTCTFVLGDLTAETIPEVKGAFDLLLDFGTLDDLQGKSPPTDGPHNRTTGPSRLGAHRMVLLRRRQPASSHELHRALPADWVHRAG